MARSSSPGAVVRSGLPRRASPGVAPSCGATHVVVRLEVLRVASYRCRAMSDAERFDAFYAATRDRLLVLAFALTGDLAASRSAVRDTFIAAWHHWRRLKRLEDPESWVLPHVWSHAQRRHTARIWHRDRDLDPELKATLHALGKLPVSSRKALLTQLNTASGQEAALLLDPLTAYCAGQRWPRATIIRRAGTT